MSNRKDSTENTVIFRHQTRIGKKIAEKFAEECRNLRRNADFVLGQILEERYGQNSRRT